MFRYFKRIFLNEQISVNKQIIIFLSVENTGLKTKKRLVFPLYGLFYIVNCRKFNKNILKNITQKRFPTENYFRDENINLHRVELVALNHIYICQNRKHTYIKLYWSRAYGKKQT